MTGNKLKKVLSFMIVMMFFIGCVQAHQEKTLSTVPKKNSHPLVAPFTQVHVTGSLDVSLHTGASRPSLLLYGDARDLSFVTWTQHDGILRINLGKGYPKYGPVRVDLSSHYLTVFSYYGKGTVTGNNLRSGRLDLTLANKGKTLLQGQLALCHLHVKGSGVTQINGVNSRQLQIKLSGQPRVQLIGVANLSSVTMKGDGWVSMYWVKSKALNVRAKDNVFIQLAGISDLLDVELWDKARFNGRYLRSTRSFVKTHDHAEADIAVVKRQHTLATDSSNIYFYDLPQMKADFMAFNGAVLDMREWDRPLLQEPTRYNKGPP